MRTGRRVFLVLPGVLLASHLGAQEGLQLGEKLLAKRDLAGAEAFFREAIRREPGSWRAHADLFLALLMQHKNEEAAAEAGCAVDLGPENPQLRVGYGQALAANRKPLEAAREFERAVVATPGRPAPLRSLAGAYASAGDPRATATFEEFLELFPQDVGGRLQFAEYLFGSGQESRGNQVMREAVSIAPFNAGLRVRYATALFHQQRFLDAVEELKEARRLGSQSYSTLYILGNSLWQAGKPREAVEVFEAAANDEPEKFPALHDLGRLLSATGEPGKAIPYLEKATQVRADAVAAWLDLGRAYEATGRLSDAERCYRKAIGLAPNLSAPRYALGRLLVRQGKRTEAEKELAIYRDLYDKAARAIFETDSRHAELALAWRELNQGNASSALTRFESLPQSPDSLLGQATALARLNRHPEAARLLERAALLAPENQQVRSLLTEERERLEQEEK
ncbi:MAG: tetratricopeptide repeat protein [Thermoanaerobaculia bacterium]